jgi:hypothetical protein
MIMVAGGDKEEEGDGEMEREGTYRIFDLRSTSSGTIWEF